MSIKGRMFTGKLDNALHSLREMYLYATLSKVGSGRVALDTIQKKFAQVSTGNVVEVGSTDNILVKTAHGLKEGYQIRIVTTANGILEEELFVNEVINANQVRLSAVLSASLAAGDTYDVYRPVSERVSTDGSSLSTVISPPIQIIKNGVPTTITDDTNPAEVVPMPVVIKAADGTNITINAGDINIQTSSEGPNFDSQRIGDGTGKWAGITTDLELKTHDQGVIDAIDGLAGGGLATEAKQDDIIGGLVDVETELQTLNATDFATEAKQDVLQTSIGAPADTTADNYSGTFSLIALTKRLGLLLTSIDTQMTSQSTAAKQDTAQARLDLLATEATSAVISGKLPASLGSKADAASLAVTKSTEDKAAIGATNETAPVTDIATAGLNGRLQRIAQNISAMRLQLPASLGSKVSTASLSVVLASDQTALPTTETTGTASSVDVTATGVATPEVAPTQAKWCKVYADKNNTDDIRIKFGGAVTLTTGIAIEAGRSEDFMVAGNISHIAISGNQKLHITWRQ